MNSIDVFIYSLIGLIGLLNIIASVWLIKDEDLERFQVLIQLLIIWLLPLVGSILIISLQWSHKSSDNQKNTSSLNTASGYIADSTGGLGGD